MRRYALLIFLFASFSAYAQSSINDYKYALVPEKYSFLTEVNQYGLNTGTKSFLEEKGFTVYFDNGELPKEIAGNRCSALTADVIQKKGLFSTNLTLVLKDCQGNIVFKSKEGKSREKDFATSYNFALADAYTTLKETPYSYNGKVNTQPQVAVAVAPAAVPVQPATVATPAPLPPAVAESTKNAAGTLYAQTTSYGYQLIDTSPKIVLTLFQTTVADYFIADGSSSHGIVLKKNGEWYFEHYLEGKLISEKLAIKF